ncbi:hypothetical protein L209DRAFT_78441 [Thermothelomyces heterothallicus CBS 203.75]
MPIGRQDRGDVRSRGSAKPHPNGPESNVTNVRPSSAWGATKSWTRGSRRLSREREPSLARTSKGRSFTFAPSLSLCFFFSFFSSLSSI